MTNLIPRCGLRPAFDYFVAIATHLRLAYFALCFISSDLFSQHLTISTSGETSPGAGWSLSGTNPVTISVTETVEIHPSVIEDYLNAGISVVVQNSREGTAISASILKAFGSAASLTFKDSGYIKTAENIAIASTSDALDIIFWTDANAYQGGELPAFILLDAGSSLLSNGGRIVLAGGADDGSNGGVANDGIPDQFAWYGKNDGDDGHIFDGGVNLGPHGGPGDAIHIYSNGGDVLIRGATSDDCPYPGISSQQRFAIASGTGTIIMVGRATASHGVEFAYGSDPEIAISSASTKTPAIDIQGYSTFSAGLGVWISNTPSGDVLIQSTAGTGGGVYITGQCPGFLGVALGRLEGTDIHVQVLSQAGPIRLSGLGVEEYSLSFEGGIYLGNRKDAAAVQGIAPAVTASTADIVLEGDYNYLAFVSGSAVHFSSTGDLRIKAHTPGYTNQIGCVGNVQFDGIKNIFLGEEPESYPIRMATNLVAENNITVYGTGVSLDSSLGFRSLNGGNISFYTDALDLSDSATIASSGMLIIEPRTNGTTIGLAGGAGALSLPASYFSDNFTDGFAEIVIGNNSAGMITLGGPLTIRDHLRLVTGSDFQLNDILTINGNDCRFIGDEITGSVTAYVRTNGSGRLIQDIPDGSSRLFPVGTDHVNPVTITNNTHADDEFYATASTGVYTDGGTSGTLVGFPRVDITWNLGNSGGSTGTGSVDLQFGWHPDHVVPVLSDPRMLHHNGSIWEQQSGPTSSDLGLATLTYTGYDADFSPFSIAESDAILPERAVSVSGRRNDKFVDLEWSVSDVHELNYFEVQRKLGSGEFETVGRVNVSGHAPSSVYHFGDYLPGSLDGQYRIKVVSLTGHISYSRYLLISGFTQKGYAISSIIGTKQCLLELPSNFAGKAEAILYDQSGQIVHRVAVYPGRNMIRLPGNHAAGVYVLKLVDRNKHLFSGRVGLF